MRLTAVLPTPTIQQKRAKMVTEMSGEYFKKHQAPLKHVGQRDQDRFRDEQTPVLEESVAEVQEGTDSILILRRTLSGLHFFLPQCIGYHFKEREFGTR